MVPLLPYLEMGNVAAKFDTTAPAVDSPIVANQAPCNTKSKFLICPSNPKPNAD